MDLLLDTQVFLWWDWGHERLDARAREIIALPTNRVFVSAATVWEIGIKRAQGKLAIVGSVVESIAANRFELLPITGTDAERSETLPWHHRDPFDRVIIAQALERDLTIMTSDADFKAYGAALVVA